MTTAPVRTPGGRSGVEHQAMLMRAITLGQIEHRRCG